MRCSLLWMLEVMHCSLLWMLEGWLCLLEVLEVMRCVLLCMLEVSDVLEVMHRVLLWMVEAVEGELCLPEAMRCVLLCILEAVEFSNLAGGGGGDGGAGGDAMCASHSAWTRVEFVACENAVEKLRLRQRTNATNKPAIVQTLDLKMLSLANLARNFHGSEYLNRKYGFSTSTRGV